MPLSAYDNFILAISGITNYYPLNEAGGSTSVTDQAGSLNSTTVSGVTFGTAGGCADNSTCASGFALGGQGISFTGGPLPASGAYTLELGYYCASGSASFQRIFTDHLNSMQLYLTFSANDLNFYNWGSTFAPSKNAWHFVQVAVASGGIGKLYVDGTLVISGGGANYAATGFQYIGDNPGGQAINGGKIQKVAVYNFQMGQTQVTANYNAWLNGVASAANTGFFALMGI